MRKIAIDPVTRIEGHARITIHVDEDGNVGRTQFHVTQVRGFEKFTEGRPFYEMPPSPRASATSVPSATCWLPPRHRAASPAAVRRLAEYGFDALAVHQLTPEIAERCAAARAVFFLDADTGLPPGEVSIERLRASGHFLPRRWSITPLPPVCCAWRVWFTGPSPRHGSSAWVATNLKLAPGFRPRRIGRYRGLSKRC